MLERVVQFIIVLSSLIILAYSISTFSFEEITALFIPIGFFYALVFSGLILLVLLLGEFCISTFCICDFLQIQYPQYN